MRIFKDHPHKPPLSSSFKNQKKFISFTVGGISDKFDFNSASDFNRRCSRGLRAKVLVQRPSLFEGPEDKSRVWSSLHARTEGRDPRVPQRSFFLREEPLRPEGSLHNNGRRSVCPVKFSVIPSSVC